MTPPLDRERFGSGLAGIALAYGGGAWVLIQVVESLDSLLGLPGPLVRGALVLLLIGFPVVLTTAWVQQRRTEEDVGERSGVLGLLTWRNALLGGVGVFAAWGAVAAVWLAVRGDPALLDGERDGPAVVAVLPFDNLLPDGESNEWLVAGLHEQVIHEIARLPDLRVISRTSVLPFAGSDRQVPEIAETLGADMVLEGSVRGNGQRIRATLQLIDGRTDHHAWSEIYDAGLDDLLAAQTSIARRVAATMSGESRDPGGGAGEPRTADRDALRAYLQGRYVFNSPGPTVQPAIGLYRRALEADPDFALAWAALAEAWLSSAHFGTPPHEAFPRADSAAVQALARDPDLADAHIALADTRFHYDWNWSGSETGFRKGLSLNPSHATGYWFYAGLLAALDRPEEAAAQLDEGLRLDPAAPLALAFGARVRHWAGDQDDAEALLERALALAPEFFYAHGVQGFVHLAAGRADDAVRSFRRSVAASPKFRPGLALALARAGRTDEARELAEALDAEAEERYVPPYERAFAWVGLGEREHALQLLDEATRTRDAELIWVGVEPAMDALRDEPRFREILRRMGLDGLDAR